MTMKGRTIRPSSVVDALHVVCVAAGDLDAPSELVSALPADCRATFFVVQHLRPGAKKGLAEALVERTTLPVMQVHDRLLAEQGHIYVIPPTGTLALAARRIHVTPLASVLAAPADTLFTSLAVELGHSLIGVVLSGGGADGALGIRAIRHGGGTTFAQYPGSARFPGMPITAIETGCVDFVLRPNEIAAALPRVSTHAVLSAIRAGNRIASAPYPDSVDTMALFARS
jgi:two-component system, chemotaxis family, CheB/CheR fusion protein